MDNDTTPEQIPTGSSPPSQPSSELERQKILNAARGGLMDTLPPIMQAPIAPGSLAKWSTTPAEEKVQSEPVDADQANEKLRIEN